MSKLIPAFLISAITFHDDENVEERSSPPIHITQKVINNVQTTLSTNESTKTGQNDDIPWENVDVHMDTYSEKAIEQLPAYPLPEASIYVPAPIDNHDFIKPTTSATIEAVTTNLSVTLYRKFLSMHIIRSFENELYIFEESTGIYSKLTDRDCDYLINKDFGVTIEQRGGLKVYYEIKEFIKKNHSLLITTANFQPFQYWGFENGIFDIYTGNGIVNDGRYFLRHVLKCNYNPTAKCPTFDRFLTSIAAGDEKLITLLWQVIGYLLSNDTSAKAFFAFIGPKDTGKSLLAHILVDIVGVDVTSYLNASDFAGKFSLAELKGKKLNLCMDLPDRPLSPEVVASIKALTGNDMMHSDVKFKDPVHFRPTTRLLYGSNSLIRTEFQDSAFMERMIIVPFRFSVPKDKQDYDLETKLCCEKAGIALKAMAFYRQLVGNKYTFLSVPIPEGIGTCVDYTQIIQTFASEFCEFTGCDEDKIFSNVLHESYSNFCFSKNIVPQTISEFSMKFNKIYGGIVTKKKIKIKGEPLNGFVGVRLKSSTIKGAL